jgi:hypothetical protein
MAILALSKTDKCAISDDNGVTWTIGSTGLSSGAALRVANGNGIWIAANPSTNGFLIKSADGLTWETLTNPSAGGVSDIWGSISFFKGKFYLFGGMGSSVRYYTTTLGITWETHELTTAFFTPTFTGCNSAASDSSLIAFYQNASGAWPLVTTDGAAWVKSDYSVPITPGAVGWDGVQFRAVIVGVGSRSGSGLGPWTDGFNYGPFMSVSPELTFSSSTYATDFPEVAIGSSLTFNPLPSKPVAFDREGVFTTGGRLFIGLFNTGGISYFDDLTQLWVQGTQPGPGFAALPAADWNVFSASAAFESLTLMSDLNITSTAVASVMYQEQASSTLSITTAAWQSVAVLEAVFSNLLLTTSAKASGTIAQAINSVLALGTDLSGVSIVDGERITAADPLEYGVNMASGALTRYEGFGFTGYARCDQQLYGAKADGVYRIRHGDDDGAAITVVIDFGETLFGASNLKSIESVYLGASTDGALFVNLIADGASYTYEAVSKGGNARAKPGKGLEGRVWSVALKVTDATHLDLDMVELKLGASERRMKGRS